MNTLRTVANRIKLHHGKMRITAPLQVRHTDRLHLRTGRTGRFVEACLARHVGRLLAWSRLSPIFLQSRAALLLQHIDPATHLHLAPRLQLTLLTAGQAQRLPAPAQLNGTAPLSDSQAATAIQMALLPTRPDRQALVANRIVSPLPPTNHVAAAQTTVLLLHYLRPLAQTATRQVTAMMEPESGPLWRIVRQPLMIRRLELLVSELHQRQQLDRVTSEQICQRIVQRSQRSEAFSVPGSRAAQPEHSNPSDQVAASMHRTAASTAARPVPRVVRRQGLVQTTGAATPAQAAGQPMQAPFHVQRSTFGQAPVTPAAIDINRLTEQVVQQIDRRILAYRERTGRS